jgi:hypothetical protein
MLRSFPASLKINRLSSHLSCSLLPPFEIPLEETYGLPFVNSSQKFTQKRHMTLLGCPSL